MKRLLLVGVSFALFAACGDPKKTCKDTGCSAGAVCNAVSGVCEATGIGGGTGGGTAGGNGGGGGTTGGGTGGGNHVDAGFDAGVVVDPFDDGGVFAPGAICTYAIPVNFDGGTTVTIAIDVADAGNEYDTSCASGSGANSGNDVVFAITLTEPKGLVVTATNTATGTQDSVIGLVASPCAAFNQVACADTTGATSPEVLTLDRVPAGTWYVVVDNYSMSSTPGTYDVQFELTAPVAGPANDTCAGAQELTFTSGAAMATGTTVGAFNDTAGSPLSCSARSATNPEVFYKFTLTQPQDVRVAISTPTTSNLTAAIAVTSTCGVGGAASEQACTTGSNTNTTARGLAAGTYFIVVDGNSSTVDPGEFSLEVTLLPPTARPANDTCATPATLTPGTSVTIDANAARSDYTFSCGPANGGDVVYQFTTTQAQKVTLTATGMNSADAVLALRGAPCDMESSEVACIDDTVAAPEVLVLPNLPAGTYYVVLAAYSASAGEFGLSLALDAAVLPPANDTCTAPATLVPNVSQNVDLAAAATDYSPDCSFYSGGDAVYTFTTTTVQRMVLTATGMAGADALLELRSGACDPGTVVSCNNSAGTTAPEVVTINSLPAGTYYVLLGSAGSGTAFGISLALSAPLAGPANDSCTAPEVITLNTGMATRSIDLSLAAADISEVCGGLTGTGNDVVYSVVVPANQRLTVTAAAGSAADPVLYIRTPTCATTPSVVCADVGGTGGSETATVLNGATMATYFVVVKAYRVPGTVDLMFAVGP